MENDKTYFNVIKMSEAFRKWEIEASAYPKESRIEFIREGAMVWQARAQMAIAQQLTMIAQHLGEIVKRAKE